VAAAPGSTAAREILTINAGSSSIKFAVFDADDLSRRLAWGAIERIGVSGAAFDYRTHGAGERAPRPISAPDHAAAAAVLLDALRERIDAGRLIAAGHRIVHGGPRYSEAQRVTPALVQALRGLVALDPQHLPHEIALVETFGRTLPALRQVVCFDTAFHHDLPRVARLLPIPRRYTEQGVRRYGFHGLSYAYLVEELARLAGTAIAPGRIVLAHLGNGASLAAVRDGRPIDTSMGFTPAGGVMMSTRTGDIDPGIVSYLADTEGMDAGRFGRLANFESGLLGVSGTSSDMRDLLERAAHDERAAEAVELFCYQIRKCVGAFAAALGGIDTLVFTGGIGERAAPVRERVCEHLAFLGVILSPERNASDAAVISGDASAVTVRVMRTDEEQMIAKTVSRLLAAEKAKS
jgi:acetate kinase